MDDLIATALLWWWRWFSRPECISHLVFFCIIVTVSVDPKHHIVLYIYTVGYLLKYLSAPTDTAVLPSAFWNATCRYRGSSWVLMWANGSIDCVLELAAPFLVASVKFSHDGAPPDWLQRLFGALGKPSCQSRSVCGCCHPPSCLGHAQPMLTASSLMCWRCTERVRSSTLSRYKGFIRALPRHCSCGWEPLGRWTAGGAPLSLTRPAPGTLLAQYAPPKHNFEFLHHVLQ